MCTVPPVELNVEMEIFNIKKQTMQGLCKPVIDFNMYSAVNGRKNNKNEEAVN